MHELSEGDLIQITNEDNKWFPCILIVSEVKRFGAQGYVTTPYSGEAYYRVNYSDFEIVGKAVIVAG